MIEVQLWWALVDDLEPRLATVEAQLTAGEAARFRFHFERDQREFLARRALERTVLSSHAPALPRLNLSGSEGLVACVASTADVEVGVDVENADRPAPLDVAEASFAPSELAALRALPPDAQPRRFFDHWTLKEAYVKARRRGLAIPLDQCAFALDPGQRIRVTLDPRLVDDATWWEFRQLQPIRNYLIAVAVRRPPGATVALVLRRVSHGDVPEVQP